MNACDKSKALSEARGYVGELEYQEKMTKRFTQHKCDKCGLYHIWKRKEQTHEQTR